MNVLVTHYKKKDNGKDTVYLDGKPVRIVTTLKLPIKFGYGSYNEPRKIMDVDIHVEDIISIEAEGEMQP